MNRYVLLSSLLTSIVLVTGCTRSKDQKSSLTLEFVNPSQKLSPLASTFPEGRGICYGVDVSGPGIASQRESSCHPERHIFKGFASPGAVTGSSTISLDVPAGEDRVVKIFAYLIDPTLNESCPEWGLKPLDYSKLFEVGKTGRVSIIPAQENYVSVDVSYPGDTQNVASRMTSYDPSSCHSSDPNNSININLTVGPAYPANGSDWNDYISYSAPLAGLLNQPGAACSPINAPASNCFNGGLLRLVDIPEKSSCAGLNMTDSLGAFEWRCDDSNGHVRFFSKRFVGSKGLKDLVNVDSWKSNSVILTDGVNSYSSTPSAWWNNTVLPLPDSSASPATLSIPSAIYVFDTNATSFGIFLTAQKIALVGKDGSTISFNGSANCDTATGLMGSGTNYCQLGVSGTNFHWLEGSFTNSSGQPTVGLLLYNTYYNQSYNFASNNNQTGILISNSYANRISHSAIMSSSSSGITILNSENNLIDLVRTINSSNIGIFLNSGSFNKFQNLMISNATNYGLRVTSTSNENIISQSFFTNNGIGISIEAGSHKNTFSHLTLSGNETYGIRINSGTYNTFNSILSTGHLKTTTSMGISLNGASTYENSFNKILVSNNGIGIHTTGGTFNNYLLGFLGNGSNSLQMCNRDGTSGASSGFITGTCTDSGSDFSSSYTGHSSNAILRSNLNSSGSLYHAVTFDDVKNINDSSGSALYDSILDWVQFDHFYRAWGQDGPFGNSGPCASGETCRIYDFRLKATDTVALNKSFDLTNNNQSFIANSPCPNSVDGNAVLTDQQTTPNTYLQHAIEPIGDLLGDEDGLCESNEPCLYAPNVGGYQGESEPNADRCQFSNGSVSNVLMFHLPINGI
ncbi:MAG: right-handed parallel beta-helix repeat-containing protein [Bdellovibrionales bacterium]|nr:right-handed parallel beta-helix repeat-containing protein [Bdellovibrionales bacterium]